MMEVLQGSVLSLSLSNELSTVPIAQVETLRSAVLDKALPLRNKALAVLAYLRGIDAAEIAAFLQGVRKDCVSSLGTVSARRRCLGCSVEGREAIKSASRSR